ncbi:MAG: hypothetical protein LBK06_03200, partial [Planctomycetaceae bacterium]|nr:hypothetical protein [Planctomycetaceae bacterium]
MIQQLESNIPSAPKDSPAAKWIHFVMNFLWVVLVGVLIGEVLGTLAGMYWLNTAAADENTRQLYYAVKSAMPKGMLVCAVIALFIYFGVRIVSFFKVPKVKTGNDAFKEKFLILRRENRWIALENILRGFIAERVSERPDFESADLVKVSHQLWDKVRLCNVKLLMFIVIPILILVTFPLFSSLLFYTSANVLPKSAAFLTEHTKYVGEYAMSQLSIVQSLIMFLVNIVFFVFCSVITNKAVPQVKMKKAIESEKRVVSFMGMLVWFAFIILSSWHVQYFPFLPEAFIITFLFYATGLFHNEPARYDSVSGSEMPEKTTKWFVMPLLACLAGLFFQPDNWKSIVTV